MLGRARERTGEAAVIDAHTGSVMTYGELVAAVERAAVGLAALGLGRGDVVGICLPNGPEFSVAFHGALAAAASVTPMSPRASDDELAFQLRHAGVRLLVTAPELLTRLAPLARAAGVESVLAYDDDRWVADRSGPRHQPEPDDVAVLVYSSGTTGVPKGVMLTHRNLVANLHQLSAVDGVTASDRLVAVLPFFHIFGLQVVMNRTLLAGATLVTLPRFDLASLLGALERHRITVAHVVPPIVLALAQEPAVDAYDLSALTRLFSGAAPLAATVAAECGRRLRCRVTQGYGLTEASPVTHLTPPPGPDRPGSVGPALPGTACRIVDPESATDLGPGQVGELWVRGPQVMKGYLNDSDATAAALDEDGWLHTGDLVRRDADGFYFVIDRYTELIRCQGSLVGPAELEAVLRAHPGVADAVVVASPDADAGEVPKAFVVRRAPVTPEELMAFVTGRVSAAKRVRRVEWVDRVPRSPAGKVLRRVLAEREGTRVAGDPGPFEVDS